MRKRTGEGGGAFPVGAVTALGQLRKDRLVRTCRVGKTICYSLNGQEAPVLLETLDRLFCVVDTDDGELDMQEDALACLEVPRPLP